MSLRYWSFLALLFLGSLSVSGCNGGVSAVSTSGTSEAMGRQATVGARLELQWPMVATAEEEEGKVRRVRRLRFPQKYKGAVSRCRT